MLSDAYNARDVFFDAAKMENLTHFRVVWQQEMRVKHRTTNDFLSNIEDWNKEWNKSAKSKLHWHRNDINILNFENQTSQIPC